MQLGLQLCHEAIKGCSLDRRLVFKTGLFLCVSLQPSVKNVIAVSCCEKFWFYIECLNYDGKHNLNYTVNIIGTL
jgi:hypothetical protein